MSLDIILDFVVIISLGATIFFAIRLHKKLATIDKNREELQNFLNQFTASMNKAEESMKDLKGAGSSVFNTAQEQMKTANILKEDLAFLNERGEELAGRLDGSIRTARALYKELEEESGKISVLEGASLPENDDGQPDLVRNLKNIR